MPFGATHLATLDNGGYFNSNHLREYCSHLDNVPFILYIIGIHWPPPDLFEW